MALSWSAASWLSPRPAEPSTSTANGTGGSPRPSLRISSCASSAARRVMPQISELTTAEIVRGSTASSIRLRAISGNCAQAAAQSGGARRAVDLIAQHDRGRGAVAQEVARRHRADDLSCSIGDAQMPEAQALDAADRAIKKRILGDGLQRRLHDAFNGYRQSRLAAVVDRAQDVALGDDARHPRCRAHEHAADALLDQ